MTHLLIGEQLALPELHTRQLSFERRARGVPPRLPVIRHAQQAPLGRFVQYQGAQAEVMDPEFKRTRGCELLLAVDVEGDALQRERSQ